MADNVDVMQTHMSVLNDNLRSNLARIEQTKHVISQYENQTKIFQDFPKSLKKSVLVPIGSKGFLRGQIVHTNEVFHKIGCGYVIKRSASQAIDFCERMLNETNSFLQKLYDEEKWLNDQLNVPMQENAFSVGDQIEIIENCSEKEEEEWRVKHRESVKKMKEAEALERKNTVVSDSDVFSLLDRLELMEEFEQSIIKIKTPDSETLLKSSSDESESSSYENIEINEIYSTDKCDKNDNKCAVPVENIETSSENLVQMECLDIAPIQMKTSTDSENSFENVDLAELENKVQNDEINKRKSEITQELELGQQNKTVIKTEEDIFKRLDELEKEEELLEEMELLTISDIEVQISEETQEKLMKIRFNEQVRTNFYDSSQSVSDELEFILNSAKSNSETPTPINDGTIQELESDEPVTLEIRFSHNTVENVEADELPQTLDLITKPSDLYDLPYRPKSILKNKNRLFDEPQHTGDYCEEQPQPYHHSRKHRHRERSWVCQDSFSSKNGGNDSDQENVMKANPQPLTEVKEKPTCISGNNIATAGGTPPPKKRQSRFSVSRALLTKK